MPLTNSFKSGDKVRLTEDLNDWGDILAHEGDIGIVSIPGTPSSRIQLNSGHNFYINNNGLEMIKVPKVRRTAKKLVPADKRQEIAVRLIKKVTKGVGKFTGVKVESEGRLNRRDLCTDDCTLRNGGTPHKDCKYFPNNNVANDFILKHLARYGLAKKCENGDNPWGYFYKPRTPLVFSKVYNDSETEWTTTLSLANPSDVLYAPMLVDAFNALATANGLGIDVQGSGMHTAFIQGKDCYYPSQEAIPAAQTKMFNNFAKSMRPLLPALYLLAANRIENGTGVTRSTGPRQPMLSNSDKYSAVAYRYGALEFRVFDTCYDNREQLLDNIVVMAQSVSKYWKPKYVKPNISMDKPVMFGTSACAAGSVNNIESLYVVKEHIVLLNAGLRCIKPPYMTVKEVKQVRNFKLTVRGIKNVLDTDTVKEAYANHVKDVEIRQAIRIANEFYSMANNMRYNIPTDVKKELRRFRAIANKRGKSAIKLSKIEDIAYKSLFGTGFSLGDS